MVEGDEKNPTINAIVHFTCDKGFELGEEFKPVISCMANGQWSGKANVTCESKFYF